MHRLVFTPQFKNDAVQRAAMPGVNISELATELDINKNLIYKWRREKEAGKVWKFGDGGAYASRVVAKTANLQKPPPPPAPPKASAPGEIDQLRQQVAILTEERDVLRRTLAHYLKV